MLPSALLPGVHEALRAIGQTLPISSYEILKGGFSSNALKITSRRGTYLLKWRQDSAPDTYLQEARSLAAIRAAGVVRVPEVLAASAPIGDAPGFLLQEWIATRRGGWPKQMHRELGPIIAALHRAGASAPGFASVGRLSDTPVPEEYERAWATSYREHFLQPVIERAERLGLLESSILAGLERLLERLDDLLAGAEPAPALIHGDLWRNNVLCDTRGAAVLIDPHAAYADRELELTYTELYHSFGPAFFAAYEAAWPRAPDRTDRRDLYRLYFVLQRLGRGALSSQPAEVAAIVHWYVGMR